MSNRFLALSTQDRKLAFDNAALSLHLNAVILEKDFWVSGGLALVGASDHRCLGCADGGQCVFAPV